MIDFAGINLLTNQFLIKTKYFAFSCNALLQIVIIIVYHESIV